MKINIAIDGPSAAGKSTVAKILARKLKYAHLDTGAMYRCVGYYASIHGIVDSDAEKLAAMIDTMDIAFDSVGNVYINNVDVSKEIRTNAVSMLASNVSAHATVREKLVAKQQQIAQDKGFILDGRDIGTVVLPDAELKIYMVASVEARAKRRFDEYIGKQIAADYDEIFQDIEKRDYQDMNRVSSPLKKADDAIEIDTSFMSIEEVVSYIETYLQSVMKS